MIYSSGKLVWMEPGEVQAALYNSGNLVRMDGLEAGQYGQPSFNQTL